MIYFRIDQNNLYRLKGMNRNDLYNVWLQVFADKKE